MSGNERKGYSYVRTLRGYNDDTGGSSAGTDRTLDHRDRRGERTQNVCRQGHAGTAWAGGRAGTGGMLQGLV